MKRFFQFSVFALICAAPLSAQKKTDDARDHLDDIQSYISQRNSSLRINRMKLDIFGLPQNPKKAEAEKVQRKVLAKKTKVEPTIPLREILDVLPMTVLDIARNRVVLEGGPPLGAGEVIEVIFDNKKYDLRLDGVRRNGAYFTEMKSGRRGLATQNRLPAGIQRGGSSSSAKGIRSLANGGSRTLNLDQD